MKKKLAPGLTKKKSVAKRKPVNNKRTAPAKLAKKSRRIARQVQRKTAKTSSTRTLRLAASRRDLSAVLTPLDDRLVVEVAAAEELSPGGIILTATAAKRPNEGVVLAVGRGHRDRKGRIRPMQIKPGDRVMFAEYSGTQVEVDGQELFILRESDVLGVIGA